MYLIVICFILQFLVQENKLAGCKKLEQSWFLI